MKYIPKKLYSRICGVLPVLCVDLMIEGPDSLFLLVKRLNEPLAGAWWVVGGRMRRNEDPLRAANRLAREEVGLKLQKVEFAGYYSEVFRKSAANKEKGIHTVSLVFRARTRERSVKLDAQSSAFIWSSLPARFVRNLKI